MDKQRALEMLSALSHESRLDVFRLLADTEHGVSAGAIADRLGAVQNTMSGNLMILARAGLIAGSREGRVVRYSLDLDAVRDLADFLLDGASRRSEVNAASPLPFARQWAAGRVFNVLFLCTGNASRSIMAEAIVNHDHNARFRAFSAGSQPEGRLNPEAVAVLAMLGYPTATLHSKGWSGLTAPDGPAMDFVFTLCDEVSKVPRPVWAGSPIVAHWAVPDPRHARGDSTAQRFAHVNAFRMIERRINAFAGLPFPTLGRPALQARLDEIGSIDDHSHADG